jgi:hypothetical protein
MDHSTFLKFLPLICLMLWLLSACSYTARQTFEIGDGGLLTGKPCSAPCFHNIIPGVTTEKETLEMFSTELDINTNCDYWAKDNNGPAKGIDCQTFTIIFNDLSVVRMVSFKPSQQITVAAVIQKFGPPDGVGLGTSGIEMQPPKIMSLYFDHENMILHLPAQNSNDYNLQGRTQIESVEYYDEGTYVQYRNIDYTWKGLGKY